MGGMLPTCEGGDVCREVSGVDDSADESDSAPALRDSGRGSEDANESVSSAAAAAVADVIDSGEVESDGCSSGLTKPSRRERCGCTLMSTWSAGAEGGEGGCWRDETRGAGARAARECETGLKGVWGAWREGGEEAAGCVSDVDVTCSCPCARNLSCTAIKAKEDNEMGAGRTGWRCAEWHRDEAKKLVVGTCVGAEPTPSEWNDASRGGGGLCLGLQLSPKLSYCTTAQADPCSVFSCCVRMGQASLAGSQALLRKLCKHGCFPIRLWQWQGSKCERTNGARGACHGGSEEKMQMCAISLDAGQHQNCCWLVV